MGRIADLTGRRFGRLVVKRFSHLDRRAWWVCVCDCGNGKMIHGNALVSGHTISCGCRHLEWAAEMGRKYGPANGRKVGPLRRKHGHCANGKPSREFNSWMSMLARCENPKHPAFERYAGRGIFVCERWHSFENFLADMGQRPSGMTLDRIDNAKGYFKDNCRWATRSEQNRNRRMPWRKRNVEETMHV